MSQPSPDFLADAIFLVDASSYIFRAYYAIQTELKAPDGTPTHATYGFMQMIHSLLSTYKVKRCALVWDRPEKGFRHQLFPAYKANRSRPPEDLGLQIENAKAASALTGLKQLEAPGFEADDIIASTIRAFPTKSFVVVTADKDLLQLVGPHCWCLDTGKNKFSNVAEAIEKFGVPPEKIVEIQALMGDSVDNIPGAPGIGPKGAQELIKYYGTLQNLLEVAAARPLDFKGPKDDPLKGKKLESLRNGRDLVLKSFELVGLHSGAPHVASLAEFQIEAPKRAEFIQWSQRLGLEKLAQRILQDLEELDVAGGEGRRASAPVTVDVVAPPSPAGATPLVWEGVTVTSPEHLDEILRSFRERESFCLDTETRSLESRSPQNLVGISFSADGARAYYVPLRHRNADNLDPQATLRRVWEFLESSSVKEVVFQNAKFDLQVFGSEGFELPKNVALRDTMLASFLLDPAQSHGMDALSVKYLGYTPVSFDEVLGDWDSFDQVPLDKAAHYSAEDALVTLRLWEVLREGLREGGLWEIFEKIDLPLVKVLQQVEVAGIRLNPEILAELSERMHRELKDIEARALDCLRQDGIEIPADFNLSSTKQIAWVLFEKLGLPVLKKGKTGPSTDVSVLEELSAQHAFPKILVEVRELSKLLSTYVDSFPQMIDPRTQRLHTSFSQTIAVTGRLASSNPNLQNIPIRTERGKEIRRAFEAEPGKRLISADYSQIELRLLAHITGDAELVRAFTHDQDIHRQTASLVLAKRENEVSDEDRRMAKAINFGIIYGQTPFGLSKALGIPRALAQTFIENYFRTYPGIKTYMGEIVAEARQKGFVETLFGRRRYLSAINSKNVPLKLFAERTAINSPIQGTAADLIKLAMIEADDFLQSRFPRSRLVLQVHDELIVESPEDEAKAVQGEIVKIMENPRALREFGIEFKVPLKVDSAVGKNWGEI